MAVERIYDAYQPQVEEQPKLRPQKKQATHKQTVTKKVTVKLTRFEKMLYIALITNYCRY